MCSGGQDNSFRLLFWSMDGYQAIWASQRWLGLFKDEPSLYLGAASIMWCVPVPRMQAILPIRPRIRREIMGSRVLGAGDTVNIRRAIRLYGVASGCLAI